MAITFGNSGFDDDQVSGTTSVNNNGDCLVVAVNSTSDNITAMTYAGTAMTQIGVSQYTTWTARYHSVWRITNPAQGVNDVVTTGGANWQFVWFSSSGVDQTTPVTGETNPAETTSANPSIAITTTVDNAFAIAIGQIQGTSPTAGANTSLINFSAGGAFYIFRSTNAVTPSGSFTINITAGSGAWRLRGFGLNPSVSTFIPRIMSS